MADEAKVSQVVLEVLREAGGQAVNVSQTVVEVLREEPADGGSNVTQVVLEVLREDTDNPNFHEQKLQVAHQILRVVSKVPDTNRAMLTIIT